MEWVSGNLYIRPIRLNHTGDLVTGHEHNFDHTTIVFKGSVKVRKWLRTEDDQWLLVQEREFHAPAHFLVEALAKHEITALSDKTECWCVYSHRLPQGDIVQSYTGWNDAYV
jgi:hypothetical protein